MRGRVLAVDIGASSAKIQASHEQDPSIVDYPRPQPGPEELFAALRPHILERPGILHIAVPGPVEGTHLSSALGLGWQDLDMARLSQTIWGRPLTLLMTDAEASARCARLELDSDSYLALALGTGVGGELVIQGQRRLTVGLGHREVPAGAPCQRCGGLRCLEARVAAPGLVREAAKRGLRVCSAYDLDRRAQSGCWRALAIFARAADALGEAFERFQIDTDHTLSLWIAGGLSLSPSLRVALGERIPANRWCWSRYGRSAALRGLLSA